MTCHLHTLTHRPRHLTALVCVASALALSAGCGSDDGDSKANGGQDTVAADAGVSADGAATADAGTSADAVGSDSAGAAKDAAGQSDASAPSDTAAAAPIELVGQWKDPFGTVETITATEWNAKGAGYESKSTIAWYDNAANAAITQSSADDPYTANKFSRRVWTEPTAGGFHYCTVVFGLDTLALAQASTATADDKDLDGKGCGGFPWSKVEKL